MAPFRGAFAVRFRVRAKRNIAGYILQSSLGVEDMQSNVQVQKICILPPQKGLEFLGGWGGDSERPKVSLRVAIPTPKERVGTATCRLTKRKLNWNFQRGVWGLRKKSLPWGRYGYFLALSL